MNGYELADEIKTMLADAESYYGEAESYLIKCETMLPQQQAEIEELKAKLQLHEAMDNQCASLMQQFRKAKEK